jgi:hypothetical protein
MPADGAGMRALTRGTVTLQALTKSMTGNPPAAGPLADLLADHSDLDALRARADTGDEPPPGRWSTCCLKQGRGVLPT